MNFLEKLKLVFRAYKYKVKSDTGGIKYLQESLAPGQTALDIGSHKGGYLYFMQKAITKTGKVYAFEPQANLFTYLTQIKEIYGWKNVTLEHIALSNNKNEATLYIPENKHDTSSPGATLVPNRAKGNYRSEKIETLTLDEYCEKNKIVPHFLKIDVEGNELAVFEGGLNTLKNHKPKIIVECEQRHIGKENVLKTFDYLIKLNYKGKFIRESKFISLELFDFDEHQDSNKKPYCNNFIFE